MQSGLQGPLQAWGRCIPMCSHFSRCLARPTDRQNQWCLRTERRIFQSCDKQVALRATQPKDVLDGVPVQMKRVIGHIASMRC